MKINMFIRILALIFVIFSLSACTKTPKKDEYSEYETIISRVNNNSVSSKSEHNNQTITPNWSSTSQKVSGTIENSSSSVSSSKNNNSSEFTISHLVSVDSSKDKNNSDKETSSNSNTSDNDQTAEYRNNWTLTFEDNFDGNALDMNKWGFTPEWKRDTCYWKRDAVSVKDGNLILSVINTYEGYHAGAIRTIDTFKQAYGYFEVRCKAPTTSGINNSFWLMGGSMNSKVVEGGYDGAEIDIFETYDYKNKYYQNAIHWDGYGSDHRMDQQYVNSVNIYDGNFHIFGFAWTKNEYIFYVDGKKTWRTTAGGVCQVPLYMKLTTCTGGWVGNPDPAKIPTEAMVVDYVRVYKDPNL